MSDRAEAKSDVVRELRELLACEGYQKHLLPEMKAALEEAEAGLLDHKAPPGSRDVYVFAVSTLRRLTEFAEERMTRAQNELKSLKRNRG